LIGSRELSGHFADSTFSTASRRPHKDPTAGFTITYVGTTTYQLLSKGYTPICGACPPRLPVGRMHIPVTEIHAVRLPASDPITHPSREHISEQSQTPGSG